MGKTMYYVIIDGKGNLHTTEKSEEVDEILKSKEGIFYVITIYNSPLTIEKYQTAHGKIYRIDVLNV